MWAYILTALVATTPLLGQEQNQNQRPSPLLKYTPATIEGIDREYRRKVLPIFKKACYDCHSMETRYPWFYEIPAVQRFIDVRVVEAREDVLMKESFPFSTRHDPLRVLATIKHVIASDIMPRFEYQILFWEAFLTDEEKQTVLDWTDQGIKNLSRDLSERAGSSASIRP